MAYFTIAYFIFFAVLGIFQRNYEFVYYSLVIAPMILTVIFYYKKFHLSPHILLGLALLGLSHILGMYLNIFGTRLYDFWLIPNIFRYDNFIHMFGIFIIAFIAYNMLYPHLDKKIAHNTFFLSIIIISISMGIGAFNEILEFSSVIFLNASSAVGDYVNNTLDLTYNFVGALAACFFIMRYHKKKFK